MLFYIVYDTVSGASKAQSKKRIIYGHQAKGKDDGKGKDKARLTIRRQHNALAHPLATHPRMGAAHTRSTRTSMRAWIRVPACLIRG